MAGALFEVRPLPRRVVIVRVPPAATEQAARVPAATSRTRATSARVQRHPGATRLSRRVAWACTAGKSTGAPRSLGKCPANKSRSEPFGLHLGCQIIVTTATRKHSEVADAPHCTALHASRNSASPGTGPSPRTGTSASHVWILRSAGQHRPVAIATAKIQQPSPIHGHACQAAERSPAHNTMAPRTGVKRSDRSAQFVLGWKYRCSPGSWRGSVTARARAA
jgi:hypothetical protein